MIIRIQVVGNKFLGIWFVHKHLNPIVLSVAIHPHFFVLPIQYLHPLLVQIHCREEMRFSVFRIFVGKVMEQKIFCRIQWNELGHVAVLRIENIQGSRDSFAVVTVLASGFIKFAVGRSVLPGQ